MMCLIYVAFNPCNILGEDKTASQRSNLPKVVELCYVALFQDTMLPHQHGEIRSQTVMIISGQWPPSSRTEVRETGRNSVPEWKALWTGSQSPGLISQLGSCVNLGEACADSEPPLHKGTVMCALAASESLLEVR